MRPTLVAFLVFDKNRTPQLAGTGFIVGSNQNQQCALVVSAKHVLAEGVLKHQRPHTRHSPSALFVSKRDRTPSLEPSKLKVLWGGSEHAATFDVSYVHWNESLDIATCIITTQPNELIPERVNIPLDIDIPAEGEVVHMVSNNDLKAWEMAPPTSNLDGTGQWCKFFRRMSIRIGVVTGVYHQGYRQYRWPCFTTSIPAEPGMSGGFVYRPREGVTVAACGVVCADNSTEESRHKLTHCGESVIGCTWPALGLHVPLTIPPPPNGEQTYTLLEMIRRGDIPPPLGGIERIKISVTDQGELISMDI